MTEAFAPRLALVLKALSISRVRLASDLGVDKTVVGRWLSGVNTPTGHNLSNLTALITARRPAFTMLDWDADQTTFVAKLGVSETVEPEAYPPALKSWLPPRVLSEAVSATALRGEAYEGFWRSTRPSNEFPGRFVHDRILVRRGEDGFLKQRIGVIDMRFDGVILPSQTQTFGIAADEPSGVFIFSIMNAVTRQRADVLDGLTLTCLRVQGGTPVAAAVLMERTGLLSGDVAADDAQFEASIDEDFFATEDSAPASVRERLFRDVGPTAMANGGAAMLMMSFADSLSRGPDARVPFPR